MQDKCDTFRTDADRLRILSIQTQKTWAQIASELDLSVSMVHQVVKGSRKLSPKALYRLDTVEKENGITSPQKVVEKKRGFGGPIKIGSITTPERLYLRDKSTDELEQETRDQVGLIASAPPGRVRINTINLALQMLLELQERCVDEWTGRKREERQVGKEKEGK